MSPTATFALGPQPTEVPRGVTCRLCQHGGLVGLLSLGQVPLAGTLLLEGQLGVEEPRFPLEVAFCPTCSLVQLVHVVPPEQVFGEHLHLSSTSAANVTHARQLVEALVEQRRLRPGSLVVEVASNDGYLLQWYRQRGITVLGVEPARNIAAMAMERGIPTENTFFSLPVAERLARDRGRADVIHAHNVLGSVPDLRGVLRGLATLLADRGVAVIEVPYVRDLVDKLEFDTIHHDILCYFSMTALESAFRRHGLSVLSVERIAMHGGSLRLVVVHPGVEKTEPSVRSLLDEEAELGVNTAAYYQAFSARVAELGRQLIGLLRRLKAEGRQLAAYGASAKGSTLLNSFGIGPELIDFVVDRNPHKHGRYMPGVRVPVLPPEELLRRRPDHVLLLGWSFAEEILAQQSEYLEKGGRFILPVPHPRIVDRAG